MTKTWTNIKETELNEKELDAANKTLTLTVNKSGEFIYSDMGDPANWNEFVKLADWVIIQ